MNRHPAYLRALTCKHPPSRCRVVGDSIVRDQQQRRHEIIWCGDCGSLARSDGGTVESFAGERSRPGQSAFFLAPGAEGTWP